MTEERLTLGKWGEDRAVRFLKKNKFKILERNFCCPIGEIDIIARKKDLLVFAEVKTRRKDTPISPRYSVTSRKQRKIIRIAQYYLKYRYREKVRGRFDVIEVIAGEGKKPEDIIHLPGAFRLP